MYSTRLHVYTRASLTDILARKSARVGQVGGQVGEDVRIRVSVGPMEFKLYEAWAHIAMLAHASLFRRYTLKYGKLATKYPWIYGYFYTVQSCDLDQ